MKKSKVSTKKNDKKSTSIQDEANFRGKNINSSGASKNMDEQVRAQLRSVEAVTSGENEMSQHD